MTQMTPEELCLFIFTLYKTYGWLIENGLLAAANKVADKVLAHPRNLLHYQDTLISMPWYNLNADYMTQNLKVIKLDGVILQQDIKKAVHLKFFEKNYFTNYFTTIQNIYHTGYAFSTWVIEYIRTHPELFCTLEVLCNDGDDLDKVDKLFREREPTNIAMNRYYDQKKLESTLGYGQGAYQQSKPGNLMPNIAVKCRTPVKIPSSGDIILVWVINLIGAAFDCSQQPDCQHFCRKKVDNSSVSHLLKSFCKNINLEELKVFYYKMWLKAFEAVNQDPVLTTLKVVGVGSNNFSPFRRGEQDFIPIIQKPIIEKLKLLFPGVIVETLDYHIPQGFSTESIDKLEKTLFVNAWDPWSMAGNGNAMDNSLDGYWGRSSGIGLLCHDSGVFPVKKVQV